jgi:hypothetical protein
MRALAMKPWYGNVQDERCVLLTHKPSDQTLALERAMALGKLGDEQVDWVLGCATARCRIAEKAIALHRAPVFLPAKAPRRIKAGAHVGRAADEKSTTAADANA